MDADGVRISPLHTNACDGVLRVTVPVAETAKPHKVEIQNGEPQTIEAGSSN